MRITSGPDAGFAALLPPSPPLASRVESATSLGLLLLLFWLLHPHTPFGLLARFELLEAVEHLGVLLASLP